MDFKKFLTVVAIFTSFCAYGQKVKYKDVYPLVAAKNYDAALPLLKVVLRGDTANASANLYLGTIFYTKSKAFDALKETDAIAQYSDSATFYLLRAKRQVNEKDVRKNDDYYAIYQYNKKDTTKPISNRDTVLQRVTSDIAFKLKDAAHHKLMTRNIFVLFNKSVGFYGKAGVLYNNINGRYKTLKELYMLSDASMNDELNQIIVSYDSSLFYLETYKKAIKEYPIKGYNQHYEIENIETYRLDGLKKTDFLGSKLILWNYAKWAKEIQQVLDTDIKGIREKIVHYDDLYNGTYDQILAKTISFDSASAIKPDKKLYMLTNKYDYNSVALKLLDYKQKKLDFLSKTLSRYHTLDSTYAGNFETKTIFYFDIIKKIGACDSFLQKLQQVNFLKESPKYNSYITKKFVDAKGIKTYLDSEKDYVKAKENEYKEAYRDLMYNYIQKYSDTSAYASYNNNSVPLFLSFDYSKSNIKAACLKEDKKGNVFVAGYVVQSNGTQAAFVCKTFNRQLVWFKNINTKTAGASAEFVTVVEPMDEGCIVVVNTKTAAGIKNTVIKYDKAGVETMNRKFDAGGVVRQAIYDEINDNFILAAKGEYPFDYPDKEEPLNVSSFDNTGAAKWVNKFNLSGNVAGFNKIFEGYLLTCNYTSLSTGSTAIASKAGASGGLTNIFLLKIATNGTVSKFETITSDTPVYAIGTVRVSNSNINILGYEAALRGVGQFGAPARTKRYGKVITSSLDFIH